MARAKKAEHPAELSEVDEKRLAIMPQGWRTAPLPARYEAAKAAFAECVSIDECAEWADQAVALKSYGRQYGEKDIERMAMRLRARAFERIGVLLGRLPATAGNTAGSPRAQRSERAAAAADAGLSEKVAKTALRVAKVPHEEFEAAVESPDPPTIKALAARGTKSKPKPEPLIDLQGRSPADFNRSIHVDGHMHSLSVMIGAVSPEEFIRGCVPQQYVQTRRDAVRLAKWLAGLVTLMEALE